MSHRNVNPVVRVHASRPVGTVRGWIFAPVCSGGRSGFGSCGCRVTGVFRGGLQVAPRCRGMGWDSCFRWYFFIKVSSSTAGVDKWTRVDKDLGMNCIHEVFYMKICGNSCPPLSTSLYRFDSKDKTGWTKSKTLGTKWTSSSPGLGAFIKICSFRRTLGCPPLRSVCPSLLSK